MTHAVQARLYKYDHLADKRLKSWILDHLKRLSADDRRMRFFSTLNDEGLEAYVESITKEDDIFLTMETHGFSLRVTGFLHAAKLSNDSYEIGVTVDADVRRNGVAAALFDRAFTAIRAKGCKRIYITCLRTNAAMQRIVKKYELSPYRDPDGDFGTSSAVLEMKNSHPDFYAFLLGLQQDQVALFDLAVRGAT